MSTKRNGINEFGLNYENIATSFIYSKIYLELFMA